MMTNNPFVPVEVIKFQGLIRYLQDFKFQAYHIWTKQEAKDKKPEFDKLMARAESQAKELNEKYNLNYKLDF